MLTVRGGCAAAAVVVISFGLLVTAAPAGNEPKDLDKIPKPVLETLKAKFPAAKIQKWSKEVEGGKVVYDIEFKLDGRKAEADILEDGTLHNFEKEFDARDLPKAVTEAIAKR